MPPDEDFESPVDRIEAAAKALEEIDAPSEDDVEEEVVESVEEEVENEDVDSEQEEQEGEEEEKQEAVEKEEKGKKEEKEEPEHWRWAQLRRREKQIADYESRMEAKLKEIEEKSAKYERFERLMREDPEEFAKQLGDPDDIYERWTERRLNGGKPGEQELWNELQLLKKELRSKDEQERQKQEEFKVYQQQQQIEQHIQSYVQESDKIVEDEELSSKFPNLAITPSIRRRAMVQHAVGWCISNSPDTTFQAILEHLDNTLGKEYSELDQLRSRAMGAQKKTPEAQGAGKPAAKRKKKTISNVDEAAPSVNFVPISQDERIAAAAKELPDFSVGLKNS